MPFPLGPMSEDVFSSKTLHRMQKPLQRICTARVWLMPGGGGALPLLTVVGTCRWTGYDFPVITIDTGYLNRPNWLLAGYSVYHRVASQPTMFMTGPRSRHQRRCVRDATDFYECMMIQSRIESPSVRPVPTNLESTLDRETLSPSLSLSQSMHMTVFSKVYCDRVYFCAPSGVRQGQVFTPSGTPYPVERWVPSPPRGGGGGLMPLRTPQMHELRTSALRAPYGCFTNAVRIFVRKAFLRTP